MPTIQRGGLRGDLTKSAVLLSVLSLCLLKHSSTVLVSTLALDSPWLPSKDGLRHRERFENGIRGISLREAHPYLLVMPFFGDTKSHGWGWE